MPRLPQPPPFNNPNNLDDLKSLMQDINTCLQDIIRFLREYYDNGSKHVGFTQEQIDSFTDQSYLGTIVFNETTNESNVSFLDNGIVKWRSI